MGYIYKIVNKIDGKLYIGKTTKSIEERFKNHINKAKKYTNRYLYDAMNYYGYENFYIEKIEECDNSELNNKEIYWIKYYNSTDNNFGYNMTIGGDGGDTWSRNKNKDITSMKLILANRGRKRNKEFGIELSKKFKGRKLNSNFAKIATETRKKNIVNRCGYSSWEDRLDYISDCKKLFFQLPKKDCVIKKEHIHANKGKTYDEIYSSKLYAKKKKENSSKRWMSSGNPNYVEIDSKILLKKILNNEKVNDIATYFNISKPTVYSKCDEYFGTRKTREVREIYEKRIK